MGVFVLVIIIKDAQANIFDNAQGVESEDATTCITEPSISEYIAEQNANRAPGSTTTPKKLKQSYPPQINGSSCNQPHTIEWRSWRENPDGTRYDERDNEQLVRLYGSTTTVPSCENLAIDQGVPRSESHSYLGYDSNGNAGCYTTKAVADADTCETKDENNAYESHMSQEAGISCLGKDDGSVCPVKKDSSITLNSTGSTYNFYSFDTLKTSDSCYQANDFGMNQSEPVDEIANNMPQGEGQCAQVNGIDTAQICNENPANVCDQNGNCSTGCGTYEFAGQSEFICFSNDIDGDTVPDYKDPDKDGDGIHNDQDTDQDGDGIDDPQYQYGSGSNGDTSNIETLLGRIAQNTENMSGGGGGSSGNSQGVIDAIGELGEQIEESTNVTIGTKGTLFTEAEAEAEIQEATEKLNAKIEEIKDHFSSMFSIGSGTGSFSGCFDIAQINGSKHGGCIDEYADEMSMVAIALLFIFALISVVIILR